MSTHILITGGAGFIGTNLCEYFIGKEYEVTVVDNLTAGNKERLPTAVTFHKVDICDTDALARTMQGIDIVVHLAALPRVQFSIEEPMRTHEVNVTGTSSVLEAAKQAGVKRVVFASSSSVYGDQESLPLTLAHAPQPKSPYALHKLQGEEMMRLWSELYGIETVSLRFFNVYGPHLDPTGPYALVIGLFLRMRQEGKPLTITGDGEQTRDFTHVRDLARAIDAAATKDTIGNGEVLNIGVGEQTSINTLADLIGGEKEYIAPRIEPKHTMADNSLTRELLGWQPTVRLEDGVAELKQLYGLTD